MTEIAVALAIVLILAAVAVGIATRRGQQHDVAQYPYDLEYNEPDERPVPGRGGDSEGA